MVSLSISSSVDRVTHSKKEGTAYVKMTTGMTVVTPTPRPTRPVKASIIPTLEGVTRAKRPRKRAMIKRDPLRMVR